MTGANKMLQGDGKSPLEGFRRGLACRFPGQLDEVMEGYLSFSGRAPKEGEPKDFAAHHGACKAALAHLDLLLKLAEWAEKGAEAEALVPETLIAQARAAICGPKDDGP